MAQNQQPSSGLPGTDDRPRRPSAKAIELLYKNKTVVCATSASLVSTLVGFPLDSIKARLQTDRAHKTILGCARAVHREEGLRGFFRGVWIPLWSIAAVRATSFTIYTSSKNYLHTRFGLSPHNGLHVALSGALAGFSSGAIISVASAPFELVKIKRQLEFQIARTKGVPYREMGTIAAGKEIWKTRGVRGIYTGLPLHFTRDTLGTGLYFGLYDSMKLIASRHAIREGGPVIAPSVAAFLGGSLAGLGSWFLVYPVDVVKTNVQQRMLSSLPQRSAFQTLVHLARGSDPNQPPRPLLVGISRLYRGLGVSAIRSMLTHGLVWSIYESMTSMIERAYERSRMAAGP